MRGGVFKIYVEPESPNEGASSRYMLNRNRGSPMRGRVLCVDPTWPNEGPCLMSRTEIAKRGVVFKIYDEPV